MKQSEDRLYDLGKLVTAVYHLAIWIVLNLLREVLVTEHGLHQRADLLLVLAGLLVAALLVD